MTLVHRLAATLQKSMISFESDRKQSVVPTSGTFDQWDSANPDLKSTNPECLLVGLFGEEATEHCEGRYGFVSGNHVTRALRRTWINTIEEIKKKFTLRGKKHTLDSHRMDILVYNGSVCRSPL